jgi:ferredoxin--NADP+ reductase
LGARTKDLLILEKELKNVSDEVHIVTDDGSYGKKGFVTDALKEILSGPSSLAPGALVYAVGPIPMMKAVSSLTKEFKIHTIVSLNTIMVDATGMCGCCRVTIGGQTKFSCIDGPEFDAALIDWDELTNRNRIYTEQEKHICKLEGFIQ